MESAKILELVVMALKLSKLDLIVDDIILKSFNINILMNESFKMNTEECRTLVFLKKKSIV
ncbi:hypothetical protein C2G38_2178774 [Gigaspora rosea]|uniref:Uncharacterized protein n=1 Tax=Gigaspora rosea TaxID=44941 RepID=A0A397VH87_9GLOM|nr:hypothetical protein C2G38_2178774 [Gigaspora rosea]